VSVECLSGYGCGSYLANLLADELTIGLSARASGGSLNSNVHSSRALSQ